MIQRGKHFSFEDHLIGCLPLFLRTWNTCRHGVYSPLGVILFHYEQHSKKVCIDSNWKLLVRFPCSHQSEALKGLHSILLFFSGPPAPLLSLLQCMWSFSSTFTFATSATVCHQWLLANGSNHRTLREAQRDKIRLDIIIGVRTNISLSFWCFSHHWSLPCFGISPKFSTVQ